MSDEAALRRAICADPDEDTPRLAFADYLEENDNAPRAAFIRGQVELATLQEDSMHRREIAFRCRQLLDANEEQWLDPRGLYVCDWAWSRGFVETFTTVPRILDASAEEVFDTHPLRRLWLWELEGDIDGVSLIPQDNHITALDLMGNNLNVAQLKKLAKMPHLPHLRELGLMFNDLRDSAVKVLCGEPFFQRLELIRVQANPGLGQGCNDLRKHFKDRVSFDYDREPDRLYTIREDCLYAGWGNDFTQLLVYSEPSNQSLAVFDHLGNLIRTEQRQVTHDLRKGVSRGAARDAWLQELGHVPATIKIKRFHFPNWLGLRDFGPLTHRESTARWLEEGRFWFGYTSDGLCFNRNGEVTAT